MRILFETWHWILAHKTAAWAAIGTLGGIIVTTTLKEYIGQITSGIFAPSDRRDKAEARRMAALNLETRSIAQKVQLYAHARQQAANDMNLSFTEEELRDILTPKQAERLFAALILLQKEGMADRSAHGEWKIK